MPNPNAFPTPDQEVGQGQNQSQETNPWDQLTTSDEKLVNPENLTREENRENGKKANESAQREQRRAELLARRAELIKMRDALDQTESATNQTQPVAAPEMQVSPTPVTLESQPSSTAAPEAQESKNQLPTPAEIAEAKQKAKNSKGFKRLLNERIIPVALAAALAIGGIAAVIHNGRNNANAEETPTTNGYVETTTLHESEKLFESLTGIDALDETIDGSLAQYDKLGCANTEGKINSTSIANPRAVAERLGWDFDNLTPTERGKIHEYLAYSQDFTTAADARVFNINGFRNLSQAEAEDRIRAMSPDEKWDLIHQLKGIYDNTEYEYTTGSNRSYNVQRLTNDGHSGFKERILNQNTKMLRGTTTLPDGTRIIFEEKDDCGNSGDLIEIHLPGQPTPTIIEIGDPDTPTPDPEPETVITTEPEDEEDHEDPEPETAETTTPDDGTPTPETHDDTPTPDPDPTPSKPDRDRTPTPTVDPAPERPSREKDEDNLTRIDDNIKQDIGDDTHSDETRTHQAEAPEETKTDQAPADAYDGTTPTAVQNEDSKTADQVTFAEPTDTESQSQTEQAPQAQNVISPENNYTEDRGAANANNAAENPVQADTAGQQAANQAAETQQSSTLEQAINNFGFN